MVILVSATRPRWRAPRRNAREPTSRRCSRAAYEILGAPRPLRVGMPPRLVPILTGGIDDAAVGFEELVRHLEDRQDQGALRAPGGMAAARLAPDEFAGLAGDPLGRAVVVDESALDDITLLDADM